MARQTLPAARSMSLLCASSFIFSSMVAGRWTTYSASSATMRRVNGAQSGEAFQPEEQRMLNADKLVPIQAALKKAGVDGWLIFDFHGLNPVALGMLELHGMATRRIFVFIPASGTPVALTHAIEQGPWRDWPSTWNKLK